MGNVVYSMSMSADGYIVGPDGTFDWSAPDEQLHRFHNEQTRSLGAHLMGRRLYETMLYWETIAEDPSASEVALEFAQIWNPIPKIVFSRTLPAVEGNARLARGDVAAELAALRDSVDGEIGVGGAQLAGEAARLGLIDEYRMFICPVAVGGGTPYFPQRRERRLDLELVETRALGSGVTYLRFRAASDG